MRFTTLNQAVRRGLVASAAVALVTGGVVATTPGASAATGCGARYAHSETAHMYLHTFQVTAVQNCPIWKADTPVYREPSGPLSRVGYLNVAGNGNWFVCRTSSLTDTYTYNGYTSRDWAITKADNGQWGWVPAVFFSGTQNYWAGLKECTTYEAP